MKHKIGLLLAAMGMLFTACARQSEVEEIVLSDLTEETSEMGKTLISEETAEICIYIFGAVNTPGVYKLPVGSRVVDAIEAAGGFGESARQTWVNQAALLSDGEQIFIPTEEEAMELETKEAQTSEEDGKININTASVEELMKLPGIGESKARSIVQYRSREGAFCAIEELMNVPGIKEGVYNQIKDLIKIE